MKKKTKKLFSILMCLGMILQNFAFLHPVFADDLDVSISEITQGNNDQVLVFDGEAYLAPTMDDIKVKVALDPNPPGGTYFIKISCGGSSNGTFNQGAVTTISPFTDFSQEVTEYTVSVYNDWSEETLLASTTFKIKFTRYNELSNGHLYVTEVKQGGEVVEPNEYDTFELNDAQDIYFKLKGEGLVDEFVYELYDYHETTEYTGSELNNGITYIFKPEAYGNLGLEYSIADIDFDIDYKKGNEVTSVWYSLNHDDSVPSFNESLFYTDYPSISFQHLEISYDNEKTLIASKYHNQNHTLSYRIDGENFANKNYSAVVTVNGDNEEIYNETFTVSGTDLNNGYNLELMGLNLAEHEADKYTFHLNLAGITRDLEYSYERRSLTLTSIKQNETELTLTDGVYQVPGFSRIYAKFDISDYQNGTDNFTLKVLNNGNGYGTTYQPGEEFGIDMYLGSQESTYDVFLCESYDCNTLYAYMPISVNVTNYDNFLAGKIYISNVTQGGETALFDTDTWNFHFNNKQDVRFHVYGTNLIDDVHYEIVLNYNTYATLLGSELEQGVDVVYHTNDYGNDTSMTLFFNIEDTYYSSYCYNDGNNEYCNNTGYNYLSYSFDRDVTIPTYTGSLIYTNNKDVPINAVGYYNSTYTINSNYHNQNNTLSYRINGNNFENKNYNVSVRVLKGENEEYFTHTYSVNGSSLNNGYDLELTGLTLALRTDYTYNNIYTFEISICDVSSSIYAEYNSSGKSAYVGGEFYHDSSKQSLISAGMWSDAGGAVHPLNENYFANGTKLGANYSGYNFDDNTNYDYKLEYGYVNTDEDDYRSVIVSTLKSGKVMGQVLNNDGLDFSLDNSGNYDYPLYRLTIKNGIEIIAYDISSFALTEAPSLVDISARANGQELQFINTEEEYSFIAPRNKQVSFIVSGVGFENRDYEFDFCSRKVTNGGLTYEDYGEQVCEKQTLKGSEINSGTAKFIFDKESAANVDEYQIVIYGSGFRLSNEVYTLLNMVDADQIIVSTGEYNITADSEMLKDIVTNTSYNTFINKIVVAPNYTVRVYDKTGNNVVNSGKIGTGMILKVLGSNDEVVMELLLVVRGDVTGDGDLTITDLVKTKRHLSGISLLTGAYKVAGAVTNTNEITVTDLVKMSRDVANIEELS